MRLNATFVDFFLASKPGISLNILTYDLLFFLMAASIRNRKDFRLAHHYCDRCTAHLSSDTLLNGPSRAISNQSAMTTPSSLSEEDYIKRRYERWRYMNVPFAYKETKSIRLAQILSDTGGLAPLALELGVGPGGIAAPMSRRGMHVVGIDLSPEALLRARHHCRDDRVALLRASGFALPFRDGSFPLAYASQVLHLFDNDRRLKLIGEVRRVLRPGARFVFDMKNVLTHPVRYWTSSTSQRRRNFPSTGEIRTLLDRAGFGAVEIWPGVMPGLGARDVPNAAFFRALTHTRFFIARSR
jgi:SAM-dependent methyltransferase